MAVTSRTQLGAATLNRKWYLDVNTGTEDSPVWTGVFGIAEFAAPKDPTMQDDSDYESEGWKSQAVTALAWSIDLKLIRKVQSDTPTAYDTGQEELRSASDEQGVDNRLQVRWYEYKGESGGPQVEAYKGWVAVTWTPDGGAMDALDTVSVTLTGQGDRESITHPAAESSVPELYELNPSSGDTAGGELVEIVGIHFTGATDVEFGSGNAAQDFTVADDHHIWAITPSDSAGDVEVEVTNANGTSTETATYTYS